MDLVTAKRERENLKTQRRKCYDEYAILFNQKNILAKLYAVAENTRDSINWLNTAAIGVKDILEKDEIPEYSKLFDLKSLDGYTSELYKRNESFLTSAETFGKEMDTCMSKLAKKIESLSGQIGTLDDFIRNY